MADELPYMLGVRNLPLILEKIKSAGTPPKFTHEFLKANLGFTSSTDRSVIKVLKGLGFLSADSVPTPRYNEFRQGHTSKAAMAAGLRDGWADVFLSDQRAYERSTSELTEIFKNVTGKGESVAEKMASTFRALAQLGEWSSSSGNGSTPPLQHDVDLGNGRDSSTPSLDNPSLSKLSSGSFSLHNDVHVHLPATSDVAVYTAIFRALREELLD